MVLDQLQPKAPPKASLTITIDIVSEDPNSELINKIQNIMASLADVVATSIRSTIIQLKNSYLTALAEKKAVDHLNEALIKQQKEARVKKAKRAAGGEARVLKVKDILAEKEKKDKAEEELAKKRARREALKGRAAFFRVTKREFPTQFDLFS